jgi:hypothetical protein
MKRKFCVLGVLSLVACSSDATPATEADYDDVAQALSAVVATNGGGGEVGSLQDAASIAVGEPTADITLKATGEFIGNRLGLSYDYSVTCKDSTGKTLATCNGTTDDASVKVNWSGKLAALGLSADVTRDGAWQLTNLQSGTADVSGDSNLDFAAQFQSLFRHVSRAYQITYTADYSDVRVQRAPQQIIGGSVKYVVHADRKASGPLHDSAANFDMTGLLEFASDGSAKLTLDHDFQYAVDTSSGQVTKSSTQSTTAGTSTH